MSDTSDTQVALDRQLIGEILVRWGHARDADDWDTLAGCFHNDATIHISWISDTAKNFVTRSADMATERQPGDHNKHYIGGPWVIVSGDRAFSRCHVDLLARVTIDGVQFDSETWSRFFDHFGKARRQNGASSSAPRSMKKTASTLSSRTICRPIFFDGIDLSEYPETCKFLCFRLQKRGRTPMKNILSVYSDEEKALKAEGERWVAGG